MIVDKIKVSTEGREGIYTATSQDINNWLMEYPEDLIHNYIPGPLMFGADWDKAAVMGHIEGAERIAILTGEARKHNMNHSLAVISNNELKVFDIGEITDQDIEIIDS